jgi:DNA gyrase subunit A
MTEEKKEEQNKIEKAEKATAGREEIIAIEEEMKKSYIDYAMSVIVARALPSVEDGLKPVQRRILYAMYSMGLLHGKPTRKTARIVGECMGKFHPHGDIAIYDALVRMAQPFSLRYPLIRGQGNFGSIDGDPAAAMRYTEAKLNEISEELLKDIEKKTVKMSPNFDNSLTEPEILPGKVPNLLINGSQGIAVGMMTNIPPHNLIEVVDATIAYLKKPEISVEELMKYVQGPDFPSAGYIYSQGLIDLYKNGRGSVIIRGKAAIEQAKEKERIIISELPYQVNKSEFIKSIANLVREKRLHDISNIRDESAKNQIRVVILLRRGANSKLILNRLFKFTSLQIKFNAILLALVKRQPKILDLHALIKYYVEHRQQIIKKRTRFELDKSQALEHILEGFLIALKQLDEIITTIRKSKNVSDALSRIISKFNLSQKQSQAILELRLQRLTALEREKIKKNYEETKKKIKELQEILASGEKIIDIIRKELLEIRRKYGDNRRTKILEQIREVKDIDLIKKETVAVILTNKGYVKRMPLKLYQEQRRGGKGVSGTELTSEDFVQQVFVCSTHDAILFLTKRGLLYRIKSYQIPEATRYSKGKAIINILNISDSIKAVIPIKEKKGEIVITTHRGMIKRVSLDNFVQIRKTGVKAVNLPQNDAIVDAKLSKNAIEEEVMLTTKKGIAARFNLKDVRSMGRAAYGVTAIKLAMNDEVIGFELLSKDLIKHHSILTVTEKGYGKRTKIEDYRKTARACRGIININCSQRNGGVVAIALVTGKDSLIVTTQKGMVIRISCKDIREMGRNTQGVRIIRLREGDRVSDVVKIEVEEKQIE